MKKIILFAFLISITSATTHCWEWSDLVPTRLSNWYQARQIKQQEIERIKELENNYLEAGVGLHPRNSKLNPSELNTYKKDAKKLWTDTKKDIEDEIMYAYQRIENTEKRSDFTPSKKKSYIEFFRDALQRRTRDLTLMEKYSPYKKLPSSTELRDKSMRKLVQQGWGY